MSWNNPVTRLIALLWVIALGFRVAWALIQPVLVPLMVVALGVLVAGWFQRRRF